MIRRRLKRRKFKEDTDPYYIGSYARITRKEYKKVLKLTGLDSFHMTEGTDHFVIKIIDNKIQKAVRQICN